MATAYSLALGVIVPVSAWCADRFGATRGYTMSLVGFAAGSALCGLAWNLDSMIVFRVLQAIPGGVLPVVVALTILYRIVPRDRIGAAMGMYGLGIVVAPAVARPWAATSSSTSTGGSSSSSTCRSGSSARSPPWPCCSGFRAAGPARSTSSASCASPRHCSPEMHVLTVDATNRHLVWLLCLRAVGMGIGMMPIMTGGIAAVPPALVGRASAFNNAVQRTSAALGLAVLTALLDRTQAQLGADRAGLVTSAADVPMRHPGSTGQYVGPYATYQQMQTQVFVEATDRLFVITAVITVLGVALALPLRSGPATKKKAPGEAVHVEAG